MPVTAISEEAQRKAFEHHNTTKRNNEKIPFVLRNAKTGWPLFQVSFFSPEFKDGTLVYSYALGGGNCHIFLNGAFGFAHMISKVSGPLLITGNSAKERRREQLIFDNARLFLNSFNVVHLGLGIGISLEYGPYGKLLKVNFTHVEGDSQKLLNALYGSFRFAMSESSQMEEFVGYEKNLHYTKEQIINHINPEVAVFHNGQIFVDLGEFLEKSVQDEQLKNYLGSVFKVDEVAEAYPMWMSKAVLEQEVELKQEQQLKQQMQLRMEEEQARKALEEKNLQEKMLKLFEGSVLFKKIQIMKDYGQSLNDSGVAKGAQVIELADQFIQKAKKFVTEQAVKPKDELELQAYQVEFKKLLHSKDDVMRIHNALWKPIITNIAITLLFFPVAFPYLVINAIVTAACSEKDKPTFASDYLFFGKTRTEQLIGDIGDSFNMHPLTAKMV